MFVFSLSFIQSYTDIMTDKIRGGKVILLGGVVGVVMSGLRWSRDNIFTRI